MPKLYGEVYAFKPALAYWLVAASIKIFDGSSEFVVRLPTALCGVALALAIYVAVSQLVSPRCGLFSSLALVTSFLYIEQSRAAGYDMPLALGVGIAVLACCVNLSRKTPSCLVWVTGYTGLAIGFGAKGLPALSCYVPGLRVSCVLLRRIKDLFGWRHLIGVSVFVTAVGLYLYLAYQKEGSVIFDHQWGEIRYRSRQ